MFLSAIALGSLAQIRSGSPAGDAGSAESAASAAEAGRCPEALPTLAGAVAHLTDRALQKRVGVDGVRCATLLQRWDQLSELVRVLNQRFPNDPEVLYISIHAYSDLSTQAAQQLARTAPHSLPALELDAEANEMQGRWDRAEKDYREILQRDPRYPGIHFRIARLLLSRPNPAPDFQQEAKKELQEELQIDPSNAGAEYISGELDRQTEDFSAAVRHFTRATELDRGFADAWLGLGMSLLAEKEYGPAIAPLKVAVRLEPGNPAGHYSLATAYARTGNKEAAEREFALQQQATQDSAGPRDKTSQ
ncbi:MAG TPA: tetratricopeptide repeat protein [Acidobacteriaceae bacterium]|nr:tetratricopeptide repeat protein [Acidobacteriaceae bacterium]